MDLDLSLYAEKALAQVPRLLGLGDREPGSATYGCFDRYYWHYRLHDMANARFQEAAWIMALAYVLPQSPYAGRESIAEWVQAALDFWMQRRHTDGSQDEVYPYERSFCATSFSALALSQAAWLMAGTGRPLNYSGLEKTGQWLARHDRPEIANQMAAAAAALVNLAGLTGSEELLMAADCKVTRLLESQDRAGWFPEYGGADAGYLSITLSCLALFLERREHEALKEAAFRAGGYLDSRLDEMGRHDSTANSRNTQFLYPRGLATFAPLVLERHARGLIEGVVIEPAWLDDRYMIGLVSDYLSLVHYIDNGGAAQC
jgi:hypothetical protein